MRQMQDGPRTTCSAAPHVAPRHQSLARTLAPHTSTPFLLGLPGQGLVGRGGDSGGFRDVALPAGSVRRTGRCFLDLVLVCFMSEKVMQYTCPEEHMGAGVRDQGDGGHIWDCYTRALQIRWDAQHSTA